MCSAGVRTDLRLICAFINATPSHVEVRRICQPFLEVSLRRESFPCTYSAVVILIQLWVQLSVLVGLFVHQMHFNKMLLYESQMK